MPLAHSNHITKGPLPQANGQPGGAVVWAACLAQEGKKEQAWGLLTGNRGYDAADTFWKHSHTATLKSASAPKPGLNNSEDVKWRRQATQHWGSEEQPPNRHLAEASHSISTAPPQKMITFLSVCSRASAARVSPGEEFALSSGH